MLPFGGFCLTLADAREETRQSSRQIIHCIKGEEVTGDILGVPTSEVVKSIELY